MVVKPGLVELVPTPPSQTSRRYVVPVGDVAVEVDDDFHDDTLARVVRVLRAC
jgi:hypothetical protein